MDVLSEVLRAVRLEGALFFNGEFSAPWCLSTQPSSIAPYLSPHNGQLIIYHFVTAGHAYAQLGDGRREELSAGEVVVADASDEWLESSIRFSVGDLSGSSNGSSAAGSQPGIRVRG